MKGLIGTSALVLILASLSSSQVTYGVKGGIGFANVGGSAVAGTTPVRGFLGGAYLNVSLPHFPSIQPELLYCIKGESGELQTAGIALAYEPGRLIGMRFSYLEMPVLLQLKSSMPFLEPVLYVGPDAGILLSATGDYDTTGNPIRKINIKDGLRSVDWGVAFGLSIRIFFVRIDARGTMGLSPLFENPEFAVHNEVWSLMMEIPLN